ncbi:sulfatase [Halobacterium sp. R2-5]|uniref:sulfatase n=1 Tax=Halobacterium sp. R2-5 TaxID=2715751 RepID=UPI0014230779|nr:sulfatase [Halobacterium sp. R2-5]NIC00387.1 sulfatase [Halobacterium sp. R2-5]
MAAKPNVVVVVADTTRVDDAYDAQVAPTLADLAESGTRATRAFSAAPWTLPSHASLLTGTHTSRHGAHAGHERLDSELPMLSECFADAGYETACVSSNTWLSAESGFDRGFDAFEQTWQVVQSGNALGGLVEETEERRARAVVRELFDGNPLANAANAAYRYLVRDRSDDGAARATAWITDWLGERDGDRPFFLLANYLEPHLEYRPPERLAEQFLPANATYEEAMDVPQEPWAYLAGDLSLSDSDLQLLRALYRAEVRYVDEQLAALREALADAGELEDTIFVVTADHGENIGDHGLMDHQYCLYDTLVHVPLVVDGGSFHGRGELTDLVSLVDLAPTLLDEAGVDAPAARESFQGQSFHPDADADSREFVVSEYVEPQPSMDALERNVEDLSEHVYQYDRSLQAIRTEEYKLVRGSDGSRELYDVGADVGETENVVGEASAVADDLESTLDDWLASFKRAATDESVTISEDRKERLEQLGYLQ